MPKADNYKKECYALIPLLRKLSKENQDKLKNPRRYDRKEETA